MASASAWEFLKPPDSVISVLGVGPIDFHTLKDFLDVLRLPHDASVCSHLPATLVVFEHILQGLNVPWRAPPTLERHMSRT